MPPVAANFSLTFEEIMLLLYVLQKRRASLSGKWLNYCIQRESGKDDKGLGIVLHLLEYLMRDTRHRSSKQGCGCHGQMGLYTTLERKLQCLLNVGRIPDMGVGR